VAVNERTVDISHGRRGVHGLPGGLGQLPYSFFSLPPHCIFVGG
jgi:hypothetical protein